MYYKKIRGGGKGVETESTVLSRVLEEYLPKKVPLEQKLEAVEKASHVYLERRASQVEGRTRSKSLTWEHVLYIIGTPSR